MAAPNPHATISFNAKFGADARFHTCSAENLDADALIDFLAARGKFRENAGGLAIDPAKVCNH